jgi:hypothetical protein
VREGVSEALISFRQWVEDGYGQLPGFATGSCDFQSGF